MKNILFNTRTIKSRAYKIFCLFKILSGFVNISQEFAYRNKVDAVGKMRVIIAVTSPYNSHVQVSSEQYKTPFINSY